MRHTLNSTILTAAALLLAGAPCLAQSDIVPARPQSRPIAVINAVVHTATTGTAGFENGVIENGHVLFDGGRITSVGPGMPTLPADCKVIDAKGRHLAPGFCAFPTAIGLVETLQVEVTDDRVEVGDLRPEVTPAVAINPDSDLITVSRAAGILLSVSVPDGGLISGNASALRLDGWTPEELTIDPSVGLVMTWPMVEPARSFASRRSPEEQKRRAMEELARIARFFDDMKAILAARAADPTVAHDQRAEAMRDVLSGKDPVFVQVGSTAQIESAVAWCTARGMRCVIVGGDGIERAIPLLQAHKVAVILNGIHRIPATATRPPTRRTRCRASSPRRASSSRSPRATSPRTPATCRTTPPPPPHSASTARPRCAPSPPRPAVSRASATATEPSRRCGAPRSSSPKGIRSRSPARSPMPGSTAAPSTSTRTRAR
jgi:hypothetical protein